MDTDTEDLESLLLDGVFDIPEYQRSYSWEKRQLDELLEDLRYLPEDRKHFFGNIILDKREEQHTTEKNRRLDIYRVVDGQQRLTTALILLDVASEMDPDVKAPIEEANLIQLPNDRPRLLPQDQDKEFFRDSLLGDSSISPSTPSQTRLAKAKEHFQTKLAELDGDLSISGLANRLKYDIQINVVKVDDDSEAASIFESINDRGKPLSSLEKTKSFLMYMDGRADSSQSLRNRIDERFGEVYRELFVLERGHDRVDDFDEDSVQQFHWGIYDGYDSDEYFNSLETLKSRLYEMYRNGDYDGVQTVIDDYTAGLREASGAFAELFYYKRRPEPVEERLKRLLELGRLANVLPVLIAAQLEYGDANPNQMAEVVEKCETLVFRMYAIDGRRSDTGQGKLVRLAHDMRKDPEHAFKDTIQRIEKIIRDYTDDDRFDQKLRDPDFFNSVSSSDTRYLFYHYGQQLEADDEEYVQRDLPQILSTDFQVEHILAQELDEEYIPENLEDEFEDHVHRIGNLTTAGRYWNSTYGALPFHKKKTVPDSEDSDREKAYEKSNLKVQHVLADYDQFDRDTIDDRTDDMVTFALEEWSLDTEPGGVSIEDVPDMEELREQLDVDEDEVSALELFVLRGVMKNPGVALRSVQSTVASLEDSPIEDTDGWSDERTDVQSALHSLRSEDLVYLNQRSWYPNFE
ncbi:DUF262 domain-containing protein [Haloarcula sp. Atlit-47R]|uniref:DUF262 domain-containing protein n=1 Tax=Haloarcula sp. Atlit-47R TaxID=2282132 RepID=UPI000EF20100|nr:DUF262 domain-containing protein [Haloarcula sp. Atlit-47R]RLM41920.1 DUF262 domain-containing protein [Haloarcula sp. Atlit-47R]